MTLNFLPLSLPAYLPSTGLIGLLNHACVSFSSLTRLKNRQHFFFFFCKKNNYWMQWHTPLILAFRRQKEEASHDYIRSSRTAKTTEKDFCLNPISHSQEVSSAPRLVQHRHLIINDADHPRALPADCGLGITVGNNALSVVTQDIRRRKTNGTCL